MNTHYYQNHEENKAKALAYYHKNKERINAAKRSVRKEDVATERKTEEQIKKALRNKEYRERNREELKVKRIARCKANDTAEKAARREWYHNNKKKQETLEDGSYLITLKQIGRMIGVKENVATKISQTESYKMPKAKMARCDGTSLYCRDEIEEWLPYVREVVAFYSPKKKPIKLTGAAVHIVNFMRNNAEIIKYCDEIRRKKSEVYA